MIKIVYLKDVFKKLNLYQSISQLLYHYVFETYYLQNLFSIWLVTTVCFHSEIGKNDNIFKDHLFDIASTFQKTVTLLKIYLAWCF